MEINMDFKDKVIIVTGGGTGIGRGTCIELAKTGIKQVIGNRNEEKGNEVVEIIRKNGGEAEFLKTDVSKEDEVKKLIDFTLDKYGEFQFAFNNSGLLGDVEPLASQKPEDSSYIVDVNIKGVIYCMHYQIDAMLKYASAENPCSIVNNSSILSHAAYPGLTVYSATKHAVSGLTKGAALELAESNIRVNAVGPGPIRTPMLEVPTDGHPEQFGGMVPMKRIGEPKEISDAVQWLLSTESSYVTGHTLMIDGGFCSQ
jgi:NAD(P)-dependent dehydrogenase (short-subunit alcohol dehydrogenase family)